MSGKCISDNSSAFSKYVASEVRDHRNLPLAKHWRKIKDVDKEAFWNRIKVYVFLFLLENKRIIQ